MSTGWPELNWTTVHVVIRKNRTYIAEWRPKRTKTRVFIKRQNETKNAKLVRTWILRERGSEKNNIHDREKHWSRQLVSLGNKCTHSLLASFVQNDPLFCRLWNRLSNESDSWKLQLVHHRVRWRFVCALISYQINVISNWSKPRNQ